MARLSMAEKKKRTPEFLKKIFSSPKKEKAKSMKASIASGKANTAATKKMYAAESMFNTAKARDDAKVTPEKKRPFPEAKAAAEKAGKDQFLNKGK